MSPSLSALSREYMGSAARPAILSHLASGLKPVKTAQSAPQSKRDHVYYPPKAENERSNRDIFSRFLCLLLHCCNTRHAIEAESCLVVWSSLVIHFAEAQDKIG
jgi:hypothetical protein